MEGNKKFRNWFLAGIATIIVIGCCFVGYLHNTARYPDFFVVEDALGVTANNGGAGFSKKFKFKANYSKNFITRLSHEEVIARLEKETGRHATIDPHYPGASLYLKSWNTNGEQYGASLDISWFEKGKTRVLYRCSVEPDWLDNIFNSDRIRKGQVLQEL